MTTLFHKEGVYIQGRIQRGAHPARAPLKLEKYDFLAYTFVYIYQGRIQDLKLGGGALKKIAPSGWRRENCWGISCEKSRFYTKIFYFFQLQREARKMLAWQYDFYEDSQHVWSNVSELYIVLLMNFIHM
jgi:hypothetical protein